MIENKQLKVRSNMFLVNAADAVSYGILEVKNLIYSVAETNNRTVGLLLTDLDNVGLYGIDIKMFYEDCCLNDKVLMSESLEYLRKKLNSVQELKEFIYRKKSVKVFLDKLEQQNNRYRNVLLIQGFDNSNNTYISNKS